MLLGSIGPSTIGSPGWTLEKVKKFRRSKGMLMLPSPLSPVPQESRTQPPHRELSPRVEMAGMKVQEALEGAGLATPGS